MLELLVRVRALLRRGPAVPLLDQSIARLRRKLTRIDATRTIETARGVGYRYG